uniref:START domain-containing protein n=1 Tax=Ditylenchus dipsaci TaxID=166011 RepID=A0A915DHX0_9BILA
MMSQVTEVHMEEEEENDDVLVIDEAATPAHANAEIVVVSAPIEPAMTDKEKIDAMILDENVTVEQMLNSNIVLPTLSNSAGREGCDAHQENLILVNETVNSSAKSAAQNRDLDSTVPSQWSSRLQDSNIHFGGLSNFQPKDIAKEKTPEVVEQVQESSIQTLIEHHRKDHNVEAVVVESAGFGVGHQTNDPDMSSDATHCSPVVNSDKEKSVKWFAVEDQTPVSIPEVNIFSEISENSKPSRSSHFRRKKGSSKAGLVSSGGISKKGSTHRVKPAYLMPKQELEDTIPLNSWRNCVAKKRRYKKVIDKICKLMKRIAKNLVSSMAAFSIVDPVGVRKHRGHTTLKEEEYFAIADHAAKEVKRLCSDMSLWKTNTHNNGVRVFERSSTLPSTNESMYLLVTDLPCTMEKAEAMLTPLMGHRLQWDTSLKAIETISAWPEKEVYLFPRESLDVAKFMRSKDEVVFGVMSTVHGDYPLNSKYVRIQFFLGGYMLCPSEKDPVNHTKLCMLFHADLNVSGILNSVLGRFKSYRLIQIVEMLRGAIEK